MSDCLISCESSVEANELAHVLVMIDCDSRITEVCGVQTHLHGFTPSELYGRKITEFIHEEIPEPLLNTCKQIFSAGHAWRGAIKCRTKTGGHCWRDVYLSPRGQSGLLMGAWLTLSSCEPQVIERAEHVYRRDNKVGVKHRAYPRLITSIVLIGLIIIFLLNMISDLALTIVLGLSLSWAALLLGRFSLSGAALTWDTRQTNIDPVMCYVYTGGSNASHTAAYTLALRDQENFSLANWVRHRCDTLANAARHQRSRIGHIDVATAQQRQQTQLIRQSLRCLLDDQHRATCAATRSMQLILESQQDVIQSRAVFHQLGQAHNQDLGRLQRIHNHLKTLIGHHHHIVGSIDQLSEITEELQFLTHRHSSGSTESITNVPLVQDIHPLIQSASASLQALHNTSRQWSATVRDLMLDIETSMQDAQKHFAFVRDGDHTLQAVISGMTRLTSLVSDIEGAVHQQSIARAAAMQHTESLDDHITSVVQTTRDINAGIERTRQQLDNLRVLPQRATNH